MPAMSDGYRDPDEGLDAWQRTQRSLHRNVDTICAAWPHAVADIDAIGFGSGRSFDGTSRGNREYTPVEAAACALLEHSSPAVAFIAEAADVISDLTRHTLHPSGIPWNPRNARKPMHDAVDQLMAELPAGRKWPDGPLQLVRRVERLASKGAQWWPNRPARKGDIIDGITVGARTNQSEICAYCQLPVVSGRDDTGQILLKRDATGSPYHAVPCYYQVWRSRADACNIAGCDRPAHSRGWCQSHYDRWRRTGVIGGSVGVALKPPR